MDPNLPTSKPAVQNGVPQPVDPYYGNTKTGGSPFKKILLLIIGLIVLISLVAGGIFLVGRLKSSGEPKEVTLKYWGIWDDNTIMQPIIADFERGHPNIKIQYEKQDIKGLGQYVERLTTRINNGTGPDIVRFHSSWVPQLKNYLLPFPQSVVESTKLDTDYYKTVERDMKVDGAYYGIPLGIDTLAMYVNTQLLADKGLPIPTDWNDIYIKYASELVVKDQSGKIVTPSIGLGTFDNISHASDIIAFLLLQNKANIKDLSGDSKDSAYDAFSFYTSFADGDKAVWDQTLDNSTLAFAKGNLALYFGYSWDIFTIKSLNPNLNFQVVKVPALAGRKNTVASYWSEGVSSKTKNSEEAFEFLTFLSKPETLQKLYQTQSKVRLFGTLYPRRSMSPLLSSNNLVYPFVSQADDAQSTFFSSDTYDGESGMVSQMNIYLGNAIRSINNNTSVQTAVDTLSQGVAQVLSRY
ncbi:MAG: extracellular solute-binding protein [Candidatus Levybacteria bacterium]|nr:extracellular solute-binding protein [Candidatus Levybacteria bacterium]